MDIKNQIPFWSSIIISAIYNSHDKLGHALLWIAFAGFILFMDYKANKDGDFDRYA